MSFLNGISFDVEDWFQVENLKGVVSRDDWESCELRVVQNTTRILELLERYQTRATFFVLGWVAERCPTLVKEIAERGHEIASHGYGHELIYKQTPEAFYADIRRSKEILESITGKPIYGYRAPSFSITPQSEWALDVLKNAGFLYDSSIFPTSFHNRYGWNGAASSPFSFKNGLMELPLSTYRFCGANFPVGGGGYFRLLPYFFFQFLSRSLNNQGKGVIFYLHPWELDSQQPRMKIRFSYRIRHYINLEKTEGRLEKLLKSLPFTSLADVAESHFPGRIENLLKSNQNRSAQTTEVIGNVIFPLFPRNLPSQPVREERESRPVQESSSTEEIN
jgi:polysaccharide deacetylase family protein (PEP-CTERM system associated)